MYMQNVILEILNWIKEWSIRNPEPSKSNIEQFARALNEKMLKINLKPQKMVLL